MIAAFRFKIIILQSPLFGETEFFEVIIMTNSTNKFKTITKTHVIPLIMFSIGRLFSELAVSHYKAEQIANCKNWLKNTVNSAIDLCFDFYQSNNGDQLPSKRD